MDGGPFRSEPAAPGDGRRHNRRLTLRLLAIIVIVGVVIFFSMVKE
jgi:hypothetical protein